MSFVNDHPVVWMKYSYNNPLLSKIALHVIMPATLFEILRWNWIPQVTAILPTAALGDDKQLIDEQFFHTPIFFNRFLYVTWIYVTWILLYQTRHLTRTFAESGNIRAGTRMDLITCAAQWRTSVRLSTFLRDGDSHSEVRRCWSIRPDLCCADQQVLIDTFYRSYG